MTTHKSYGIASFKAFDDEPGKFEAVVSVFGNIDLQGDRTMPGAFKNTIAAWRTKGDPIPVIWSHEWLNPEAHIGYAMPEDVMEIAVAPGKNGESGGLLVKGYMDIHKPFAAQVFDLLKERRIKEWSFAYDTVKEKKAEDGANELYQVDLIEVGPTLKGANPSTYTISAKSVMETELKEAYEAQRSLNHFIDLVKDVDDPDIARMLTKTYTQGISETKAGRFHVEARLPEYDGEKYSLEGKDVFACVSNGTGVVVDTHKTEGEAEVHVKRLESGDTTSLRDDDIRKALGLDPIIISEATPSDEALNLVQVEFDGHKFSVAPDALTLVDEEKRVGGNGILDESQLEGPVVDDGGKTVTKPWHIEERGDQFCVIKDDTGEEVACHDTRADAEAQLRALYANETSSEADSEKSDESANTKAEKWDGDAAMGRCEKASDFRSIAFELDNDSDPDTAAHWALPHHNEPGGPADDGGVSAALGRLNQTGDTVMSKESIRTHLEGHQGSESSDDGKANTTDTIMSKNFTYTTTTSSSGAPVTFSVAGDGFTLADAISMELKSAVGPDGEKIGRTIGRQSATALKEALIAAVDDFVKSVNDRAAADSEEEKSDDPEATKSEETPTEWLDRMLNEEK